MFLCLPGIYNALGVQKILTLLLHLPIFSFLQELSELRVLRSDWLPNYALLSGTFFRHAMSTPVTVLSGCLDESISDLGGNSKSLQQARIVCRSIEKLLTKLSSKNLQSEKFSVVEATNECVRVCQILHPAAVISVQFACSKNLLLQGSAIHWQEALSCAVSNSVEAYCSDHVFKPVSILMHQKKSTLHVEIIDCAAGMSRFKQLLVRLPGLSAKPKGTGLGLPFVQYVVNEVFSGAVEIDSTLDRGTHMRWIVPTTRS